MRIYPPDHQSTGNISHKRIGKESIKDEYKLYWVGRVEGYDRDNYIVYCYNDKSTRKCGKDPALTKNPLRVSTMYNGLICTNDPVHCAVLPPGYQCPTKSRPTQV